MRSSDLLKRNVIIKGTPLEVKPKSKDPGRRGVQNIEEEEDEYDDTYDNFFEFQKDLDEIEASNELARRASIYDSDKESSVEPTAKDVGFIIMEEDVEVETFSPIVMEYYEEVEVLNFKRCLYIKNNKEQCKRQAPKSNTMCAAHRN